jgi:hypothetical protein
VLTGPDGVLLVDSQFAPLTDKPVAAIRKISDEPIRFLIDTHVLPQRHFSLGNLLAGDLETTGILHHANLGAMAG